MSHQALARKYRPQSFNELLGQSHVLKALINALDSNRLHHAYLFTGTRGVGKTSLARIITKALNCEQKVSSKPCLQCISCQEITKGSFIDLIEIDAASRTGVDDTRELLEKVQYSPIKGRYKVYLIDEVHMFSKSSFNALLKTLEEPPAHVIFLLATTDPEKIPITVLSRCLQFNLKRINPDLIFNQLESVLKAEKVAFNSKALSVIAAAADGSMRDGLSLLDQAIAFGDGEVVENVVQKMLGHISSEQIYDLLSALASGDCKKLLTLSKIIYQLGLDYEQIFDELLNELYLISLFHLSLSSEFIEPDKREKTEKLARLISAEMCQLFYEIGMRAKADLNLATNPKVAFDMALLKMALFIPDSMLDKLDKLNPSDESDKPSPNEASTSAKKKIFEQPKLNAQVQNSSQEQTQKQSRKQTQKLVEKAAQKTEKMPQLVNQQDISEHPSTERNKNNEKNEASSNQTGFKPLFEKAHFLEVYQSMLAMSSQDWLDCLNQIQFENFSLHLVLHSVVLEKTADSITLAIDQSNENLLDDFNLNHLNQTLSNHYREKNKEFKLFIKSVSLHCDSPIELQQKKQAELIESKMEAIQKTKKYQLIKEYFENSKLIEINKTNDDSEHFSSQPKPDFLKTTKNN